ncbi:MAG: hypothetical protein IAF58_09270 [Leptolyngbya sp.]|nr:hypothetical protein [Candidatus Melainabacteria bacterium]
MKQTFQACLGWMEKEHADSHREISAFTDQDHLNGNRDRLNKNRQRTAEIDAAKVLATSEQADVKPQQTSLAEKLLAPKKKTKQFDFTPKVDVVETTEIVSSVIFDNHFVDSFIELSTNYDANSHVESAAQAAPIESQQIPQEWSGGLSATLGRKAKSQSMSSTNESLSGAQSALSRWFKNANSVGQDAWGEHIKTKLRAKDNLTSYNSELGIDETPDAESFIEFNSSEDEQVIDEIQTSFEPDSETAVNILATDTTSTASIRYLPSQRTARRLSSAFAPVKRIERIELPVQEIVATSIIETTENSYSFSPGESICLSVDDIIGNTDSTQSSSYNRLHTQNTSFEAVCVFDSEDHSKLSFVASDDMRMELDSLFNIDPLSSSQFSSIAVFEDSDEDLEIPAIGGKPSRQKIKGTSRSRKTQSRREKRSKKRVSESLAVI